MSAAVAVDGDRSPGLDSYIGLGCLLQQSSIATEPCDIDQCEAEVTRLRTAAWIKTEQLPRKTSGTTRIILRIYVLPQDIARRLIDRHVNSLKSDLLNVIRRLDVRPQTWNGNDDSSTRTAFDMWSRGADESLFYMFNMLDSPMPSTEHFEQTRHKYVKEAMEDLLDEQWSTGLKSPLYPYQRRSAALMLEREEHPTLQLDPRLEQRSGPDGKTFYYNSKDFVFYNEPLYYESCRGGILAETMGLGKTLICLALILATQHHLPKIPSDYSQQRSSEVLRSLQQMAVSSMQRNSIPWQVELARLEHHSGEDKSNLKKMLLANPPTYTVPVLPTRWNRNTIMPPPKRLTLAATTLIVVPHNLCKQWQSEIKKHVLNGALSMLVMDDRRKELPLADELRQFDVVLFTRSRFEMEARDGADEQGRRLPPAHIPLVCRCPYIGATRERDCRCLRPDDVYDSPLKHLHFRRLIVDEGHAFSSHNTTAVTVANKLVIADHRWVVSGTPAKDMIGVELELAVTQSSTSEEQTAISKDTILESRRGFNDRADEADAAKSLGSLANHFLQIRPWYSGDSGEPAANWDDHIYRHEDFRKRTYTGYSAVLRRTLNAMVIKTRSEDVERDIALPPLHHEVIYLEPSFFDKATANLFSLVLIANAVTSERTDQDYIFHKYNGKARTQLIANLRHSSFFWSGISEEDVRKTIKTCEAYLQKEDTACSQVDRDLMLQAMNSASPLLDIATWRMLGQTHELGLYISSWPEGSAEYWSFDAEATPVITGMTQVLDAQRHVDEQIGTEDPAAGLAGAGIRSLNAARSIEASPKKNDKPAADKGAIPASSFSEDAVLKRRASAIRHGKPSPTRRTLPNVDATPIKFNLESADTDTDDNPRKRRFSQLEDDLQADSELARARIVGTTSTKLSYLLGQVLKYCQDEKILIFYEGDHIAYYIAQALELLHIKHEIYAKSLAAALKSEYVVRFDQGTEERVLLMDVKQAAFGLNLSSASRIYFVNPVCRPDIEAQAIKRAHRIGQTRPVHVETLILRNTLEEKMHERSQRMTRSEHLDAKVLEDDHGMKSILQNAQIIDYTDEEQQSVCQMAQLAEPQQLWGRPGWRDALEAAARLQRKKTRSTPRKSVVKGNAAKIEHTAVLS